MSVSAVIDYFRRNNLSIFNLINLKILSFSKMLTDGELCACKILDAFKITQPTLSHHMKILTECNLAAVRINDEKSKWTKKMEHKQKALDYFSQKLHCSQSVLAAFAQECGITEEQALKLGSCFGGGMRKGEVCGAVTGALMVLGLLYGQKAAGDTEGRLSSNKVNDLMMDRFKEKCGSYICNDLLGCDITSEKGHQYCVDNKLFTEFCPKMVAAAVEVVEEIINSQE